MWIRSWGIRSSAGVFNTIRHEGFAYPPGGIRLGSLLPSLMNDGEQMNTHDVLCNLDQYYETRRLTIALQSHAEARRTMEVC